MKQLLILLSITLSLTDLALSEEPIRIGISVPLTGPVAEYGVAIVNGIKLAEKDFKASKNLEFFFEDNQYESKSALTGFNSLRARRVDAIYLWGALPTEAIAVTAERVKIPVIVATGKPSTIKNKNYLMNYAPGPEKFVEVLLKNPQFAKAEKIALLSNDTPYTSGFRSAFRQALPSPERIIFDETTDHGTMDYRALALKLKNSGADVVGLLLLEPDLSVFCRALRENHFLPFVFGTDQFASRSSITNCSPILDTAIYANHTQPKEFENRYIETYGNDLQLPDASTGYSVVEILLKVLSVNKTPESVMKSLREIKNFSTAKGVTSAVEKDGVSFFDWDVVEQATAK